MDQVVKHVRQIHLLTKGSGKEAIKVSELSVRSTICTLVCSRDPTPTSNTKLAMHHDRGWRQANPGNGGN